MSLAVGKVVAGMVLVDLAACALLLVALNWFAALCGLIAHATAKAWERLVVVAAVSLAVGFSCGVGAACVDAASICFGDPSLQMIQRDFVRDDGEPMGWAFGRVGDADPWQLLPPDGDHWSVDFADWMTEFQIFFSGDSFFTYCDFGFQEFADGRYLLFPFEAGNGGVDRPGQYVRPDGSTLNFHWIGAAVPEPSSAWIALVLLLAWASVEFVTSGKSSFLPWRNRGERAHDVKSGTEGDGDSAEADKVDAPHAFAAAFGAAHVDGSGQVVCGC